MADSVDPLSPYRDASHDLLQEVKPAAEPAAVLSLLREAAGDLLGIPADASEEEVRHRCLEVLEEEEFQPGDDLGTAIRMLCAMPPPVYRPEEAGPQYRQCVDRLVRRELEKAAVQLRTKPGELVQAALAELEPVAALSRSGRLWHRRLVTIGNANFQIHLKTAEQQTILRALLTIETTWPGEVVEVRRTYLARLTPTGRLARAARALEKQHPCMTSFDPAFLKSLQLAPRSETSPPPTKAQLDATESLQLAMRSRRSSSGHMMSGTVEQLWRLLAVASMAGAGVALFVGLVISTAPRRNPLPQSPPLPGGFFMLARAVYAPRSPQKKYELTPGQFVTVTGFIDDSLHVVGHEVGEWVFIPPGDLLHARAAENELRSRIRLRPNDPLPYLALGNLQRQGNRSAAASNFLAAQKLGLVLESRRVGEVLLKVPQVEEPVDDDLDIPPPPPLAKLFEGAAP